jgi:hypothetical protein
MCCVRLWQEQLMQCRNHPEVTAIDRCSGCAEPFCYNCLIDIKGQKYCGSCKVLALEGQAPPIEPTVPSKWAGEALTYAILSPFCFGVIFGPLAIQRAIRAKNEMKGDPRISGWGKANAAIVIGLVGTLIWALGLYTKFSENP